MDLAGPGWHWESGALDHSKTMALRGHNREFKGSGIKASAGDDAIPLICKGLMPIPVLKQSALLNAHARLAANSPSITVTIAHVARKTSTSCRARALWHTN